MGASGEQTQHAGRIRIVSGLVEDFMIADNDGIRAEDEQGGVGCVSSWVSRENGLGLFARETFDEMDGIFAGTRIFIDWDGFHLKGEAGLDEKFATSRGC
jgi:hypothetical protein